MAALSPLPDHHSSQAKRQRAESTAQEQQDLISRLEEQLSSIKVSRLLHCAPDL